MMEAKTLLQDFDVILSNTRRTLERVPGDRSDFAVHEKSAPLGRIAMHCATMPLFGVLIVEDVGMDQATRSRPRPDLTFQSREHCLKTLNENADRLRAALATVEDVHLLAPWCFQAGERVILNQSRSFTIRFLVLDHLIHHVAQLGVYLRMNGIAVPALYGPSVDEQWTVENATPGTEASGK